VIDPRALRRTDGRRRGDQRRALARTGRHRGDGGPIRSRGRLRAAKNWRSRWPAEIRDASLRIFDRTVRGDHALEFAALVIGLVGLSSSFGALVLARRREFGVLRHIGMTRRQIGSMLAIEGITVSGIGLFVGLGLGGLDQRGVDSRRQPPVIPLGNGSVGAWLASRGFVLLVLVLRRSPPWRAGRQAMAMTWCAS